MTTSPHSAAVDAMGKSFAGVALRSALGPPSAQPRLKRQLHHVPGRRRAKASAGLTKDGFDFLSFRFHDGKTSPSRKAKQDLLAAIVAEARDIRRAIQSSVNAPRRAEPRLVQSLASIDRRIRGWGDAVKDVDQRLEFTQLDEQVRAIVDRLVKWHFGGGRGVDTPAMMRSLGVALLADTPLKQPPSVAVVNNYMAISIT